MSSYFYSSIRPTEGNESLIDCFKEYAENNKVQIFLLSAPLVDRKYVYNYEDGFFLSIAKCKLCFFRYGGNEDDFKNYSEDFIEDLGSISDKFLYKNEIGRPKSWRTAVFTTWTQLDKNVDIQNWCRDNILSEPSLIRLGDLLLSLITGSINDIKKIGIDTPENLLDKVKRKIVLFDGDQTRFIYQNLPEKTVVIQGLSGTGKTELLLHKLKDTYTTDIDVKILFTCHNKILADSLKKRIPEFFNFMRVEEQIKWEERLWCISAWGSYRNIHSGAYRYICSFYDISFETFRDNPSFEKVCLNAIENIKKQYPDNMKYAFQYSFIDESQDFPQSFIALCEFVTERKVVVAGDIFQTIFDEKPKGSISPQIVLSKCYRTDPRTLMFAHAIGMGLFEKDKLRWLDDDDWSACGYTYHREGNELCLTREPLRRFEDLDETKFKSTDICTYEKRNIEYIANSIVEKVIEITTSFSTCTADDIGIILVDNGDSIYEVADYLEVMLPEKTGYIVNKAWETKSKRPGEVLVSNKNNVKGLEFAFVICVTKFFSDGYGYRNTLYTMLTRSFIKSYFLVFGEQDNEIISVVKDGLESINLNGQIRIVEPSQSEKDKIKTRFIREKEKASISFFDRMNQIFNEFKIDSKYRKQIIDSLASLDPDLSDEDNIKDFVKSIYGLIRSRER